MSAGLTRLPGRFRWRVVSSGEPAVGVAQRDALGTTARLAVWPAAALPAATGAVDRELVRLDLAASRFRADSEISAVHALAGAPVAVSAGLAEAVAVALAAAEWTGGLTDPTIGAALAALGYDRDFAEVLARAWPDDDEPRAAVPGWQSVRLDGRQLMVPAGVLLDLGATAKGLGADWCARAAAAAGRTGGVVVSLGGDVAVAGQSPYGGWPVLIADDHRQIARSGSAIQATQVVRLSGGALATSSVSCRQWQRGSRVLHHIVDPRTGRPAAGPWRTVSVAAAACADANAASTGAIVAGSAAPDWLADRGIPARLVSHDGGVVRVGGWPAGEDAPVIPPPERWLELPVEVARLTQGGQLARLRVSR